MLNCKTIYLMAKPYYVQSHIMCKAILCAKPYYMQSHIFTYKTGKQTGRQLAWLLKINFRIYIPLKKILHRPDIIIII